jgi:hypothetical protein
VILRCVTNLQRYIKGIDFCTCRYVILYAYSYYSFMMFFKCFALSVDELRKLLSDKDAYQQFLHSLDQVTIQNNVSGKHDVKIIYCLKKCSFFIIYVFEMIQFCAFSLYVH